MPKAKLSGIKRLLSQLKTITLILIALTGICCCALVVFAYVPASPAIDHYRAVADALKDEIVSPEVRERIGPRPAGYFMRNVVFVSLENEDGTTEVVVQGSGPTLGTAWALANVRAEKYIQPTGYRPSQVRVDVVSDYDLESFSAVHIDIHTSRFCENFCKNISFDMLYRTAVLNKDMAANGLLDYEEGVFRKDELNEYLRQASRPTVHSVKSEPLLAFQCLAWVCGPDGAVRELDMPTWAYSASGKGG